jgi:tryptophan synthase alpha chain
MGYLNPVLKYGFSRFCMEASAVGIDGLIIPDLPVNEYVKYYKSDVMRNDLRNIFLITPETPEQRIRMIDDATTGFVYMVSASATTGGKGSFSEKQLEYFKKVSSLNLKNPVLAGFGIHNRQTKEQAFKYADGAITGSAYLRALQAEKTIEQATEDFLKTM